MIIVKEEKIVKGRTIQGYICDLDDGSKLYLASRKQEQIYRDGHKTISSAMTHKVAGWLMDEITLYNMRAKKINQIGVRVKDTNDVYFTDLLNYFNFAKIKIVNSSHNRNGLRSRSLSLCEFTLIKGNLGLSV